MKEVKLKILSDSQGLHARPASVFVQTAAKFPCEITVKRNGIEVNGKSILGLMMLALGPGAEFEVSAEGDEEESAVSELKRLVESNFV